MYTYSYILKLRLIFLVEPLASYKTCEVKEKFHFGFKMQFDPTMSYVIMNTSYQTHRVASYVGNYVYNNFKKENTKGIICMCIA